MMARREVRMHHLLWHQVRNEWLFYKEETRQEIRSLGWEPPRPARRPLPGDRSQPIYDNFSGEDFLYMHRQMIADVNEVLGEVAQPDYTRVEGWNRIPRPDDPDYPVPPPWDTGDAGFNDYLKRVKSRQVFEADFVRWEQEYTNRDTLKQWSLGEFGARLEYSVHNQMHMRWCEQSDIRPDIDPTRPGEIDPRWDDPSYDWLGDTYSSHVNPVFWKLHGWVDDRIEDWRRAHGIDEIEWVGTWVGNMPGGHEADSPDRLLVADPGSSRGLSREEHGHHVADMDRVLKAVIASGKFHHLGEQVLL